ncbi:2-hydroxyglutaryl-CoA dehydratase [Candidatus Pacearchaeota archaeon]|nr:2-hydroxyglutaryl-CoA dehydratase [Candidatus Pacearchaeota archaeon]
MKTFIGFDVGSVSVKVARIDENEKLIDSIYLRNCGLIDTVKKGLEAIADDSEVGGVGVTGSGRKFVGMFVGADLVKTEVLAHTVGTLAYYPEVRTLMDIGGEDSKLMTLTDGVLENFELNSICSAGTGSFLESIAGKMGIKIEDVGEIALRSKQRLDFPSKCGVFTQSAVVSKKNAGAAKEDILMGVCRSLVSNYLTMAKGIRLEPPFVYQGATAKNIAIVKAFEEELGHKIIVPKYCDVMGAIGIGIMAKRAYSSKTNFKGYSILEKNYETKTKIADGCDNHCELTLLFENNKYVGCIGNKCEKCARP